MISQFSRLSPWPGTTNMKHSVVYLQRSVADPDPHGYIVITLCLDLH